jgi:MFS family permease
VIASIGLSLEACGIFVYSILSLNSALWMIIVALVITGAGSSLFYPANNSAVMANSSPEQFGVASGLLRTFSNAGLVCSFALALLIASLSIPREQAFDIFLGTSQLSGALASAFVSGMHSALLASITLIIVALVLSMLRGKEKCTTMQRRRALS